MVGESSSDGLMHAEMDSIFMIDERVKQKSLSPVSMLSTCEDYRDAVATLQKGAMGFIPKSYSPQDMLIGLETINSDK